MKGVKVARCNASYLVATGSASWGIVSDTVVWPLGEEVEEEEEGSPDFLRMDFIRVRRPFLSLPSLAVDSLVRLVADEPILAWFALEALVEGRTELLGG